MNLKEYRTLFIVATLGLALIAAVPLLSLIVRFPSGSERFSELWLLGPNHMAEGYPFNVSVGEEYSVFVGVGNHMGYPVYYNVSVKFRNSTQPLPDISNSRPSSLPSIYEFRVFLDDDKTWESLLTFAFQNVSIEGDSMFVGSILINNVSFSVDSFSLWDSEDNGFYYQLFFELWLYNRTSSSFQFHNRFVNIWLNMTSS